MSILDTSSEKSRSVGGSPTSARHANARPTGGAAPGYERRTAQLVDKQSQDTDTPLVAKRAMTEAYTASVDGGNYVYALDDDGNARIRRCTTEETELIVPELLDGHPVVAVDHSAFAGLAKTSSLTLPDCIREVGWNAFANCSMLRRLKLPDSVSKTDKTWLAGATQIDELIMPGCVETIDAAFLKSCKPLHLVIGRKTQHVDAPSIWTSVVREISIDPQNPYLSTDGICLYTQDGTTLVRAIVEADEYIIPAGCRAIGAHAFEGNTRIRSIALPDSIESIGEGAFAESNIEQVKPSASLQSIGADAFRRCTHLKQIDLNDGLEEIGPHAFSGCTQLTRLYAPASVRSIGKGIAAGSAAILEIDPKNDVLSIDEQGLLYQRTAADAPWTLTDATDATLEECVVRTGTAEIGPAACANHGAIRHVALPEGLMRIGESAFECCPGLHRVDLPESVCEIGERAFFCTPLDAIRIPAACTRIGSCALAYDPVQSGTGRLAAAASDMPFAYKGLRPASDSMTEEAGRSNARMSAADNAVADVQMQIRSRLTATPMGAAPMAGGSSAPTRTSPLAVEVDGANPRFFLENGLLCERADGHARVILYTGPDAEVSIPQQATEIAPYAFAGSSGIRLLAIHDRIADIGTGAMSLAEPPAILRIDMGEPIEGRTQIDIPLFEGAEGARALRNAFASGTVNVPKIIESTDRAAKLSRDAFQSLRYALERLADPFLLSEASRADLESKAARNPIAASMLIAEREWMRGFELMADLGYITDGNIDAIIERVGAKGLVAITVQLIALKRRRFDARNDYSL